MAIPLKQFTWKGQPLGPVPGDLNEVRDSLEVTTWIVDQLRQCGYREVLRLLRKTQRVVRLFEPKTLSVDGEDCPVPWTIKNSWSALAIALYIFGKKTNREDCGCCKNKNSRGPGLYCIAGGPDVVKGACYNCYYSGRGQSCSNRYRVEAKAKFEAELLETGELSGLTERFLQRASPEKLRALQRMIAEALERRNQQV